MAPARKETIREFDHAGHHCRVCRVAIIPGEWANYTAYVETDLAQRLGPTELEDTLLTDVEISYVDDHEIGWDTGHAWDFNLDDDGEPLPGDHSARLGFDPDDPILPLKKWTPEKVAQKTKQLAEDVRDLTDSIDG